MLPATWLIVGAVVVAVLMTLVLWAALHAGSLADDQLDRMEEAHHQREEDGTMLIARATTAAGDDLLILGLSTENIKRLQAGRPMDITTLIHKAVPPNLHIVIFSGETEDAMQQELSGLITRKTIVDRSPGVQ